MMRRILFLLLLGLSACSYNYNGALSPVFHSVTGHKAVVKIPVKVGLIQHTILKSARFKAKSVYGTIDVALHPGLTNAIKTELETIFDEVTVLKNVGQGRNEQFFISPAFTPTHEVSSYSCTIRLALLFRDTNFDPLVKFAHRRTIIYKERALASLEEGISSMLKGISQDILSDRERLLAHAKSRTP